MAIIEVNHVTKEYQLGALTSLKQSALNGLARLRGQPVEHRAPFKALDDVDFKVEAGEVLGIIGHNGAGKSTLLKMLAKISVPTRGSVVVKGKVAPLIEVGAGLVADLTGRENIYLNGVILGISKAEIKRKFDDIVAFAELEEFIDTPIKRYSSGMQVRLGFSIATTVDADILIVDEVLAVGDLAFQRKCFDRMESLIKGQGKTVLLVSHNIRQVERICSRAILLDHGRITKIGDSEDVCTAFYEQSDEKIALQTPSSSRVQKSGEAELVDISFIDAQGNRSDKIEYGKGAELQLTFQVHSPLVNPNFGVGIHTTDFIYLTTEISEERFMGKTLEPGEHILRLAIPSFPLLPRAYALRVGLNAGQVTRAVFYAENVLHFLVTAPGENQHHTQSMREGFLSLHATWSLP